MTTPVSRLTPKGIQESSVALQASPASACSESSMCRNPSQEIWRVRQRMPDGPRRRNASPCKLNISPSGSFTGHVPSTLPASSIAFRLKGSALQTEPAVITRTSTPLGCSRTPSMPPPPGLKFPIHLSPLGDANSTTSPSWLRDSQSVGKESRVAKGCCKASRKSKSPILRSEHTTRLSVPMTRMPVLDSVLPLNRDRWCGKDASVHQQCVSLPWTGLRR